MSVRLLPLAAGFKSRFRYFGLLNTNACNRLVLQREAQPQSRHTLPVMAITTSRTGIILLCEVFAPVPLNMHECLKWILVDSPPPPPPPPPSLPAAAAASSAPSSPLSNYIIIFLSIKIRMNNLSVWQRPGSEREGFGTAAGRQGCFWWAMHAKLTLWWKRAKRNNERKRRKTIQR